MGNASDASEANNDLRYTTQTVTATKVWLDEKLFSLRVTRDTAFNFLPGQFARLGLSVDDPSGGVTPNQWRAYSMVSTPADDELEFLSVLVPNGTFSPPMAKLCVGDRIFVDKTVYGFLTLERFIDGEDLWLISTGTGLSAYLAMLRDDAVWSKFKRVILIHGVRQANELAYREELLEMIQAGKSLIYLPVTSREPTDKALSPHVHPTLTTAARMTDLLSTGELEQRLQVPLNAETSRIMLCGNPAMVTDMRALLAAQGFAAGRRGVPGNLAVENYW